MARKAGDNHISLLLFCKEKMKAKLWMITNGWEMQVLAKIRDKIVHCTLVLTNTFTNLAPVRSSVSTVFYM